MSTPHVDQTLVLHPRTAVTLAEYLKQPALPLLITGPVGVGKATVAAYVTVRLVPAPNQYLHVIRPEDSKSIPIEAVRNLQHVLTLKVPGSRENAVRRVAVIEDAHRLTAEAQNALLKTLEEPPDDTAILLTAPASDSVLPTIQSRVRQLAVLPPPAAELEAYFVTLGYGQLAIQKALALSGELPGLAAALLEQDDSHPLMTATVHARGILQSTTYDRLLLVDGLSKQKELCQDILFILMQMSRIALARSASVQATERWRKILHASYEAGEELRHNAQTKLVLTNLMLAF
jgi:hypothetical protein